MSGLAKGHFGQMELVVVPLSAVTAGTVAGRTESPNAVYGDSEEAFARLSEADYAAWVKKNWRWTVMGKPPWTLRGQDLYDEPWVRYYTMIRAPDDPVMPGRTAPERSQFRFHDQWVNLRRKAKADPRFAWDTILKVTEDGRPRTLNRIAVEGFGQTADSLPTPIHVTLLDMVANNWLAFYLPPGYQKDPVDPGPWLFWNDATWRKHHGDG